MSVFYCKRRLTGVVFHWLVVSPHSRGLDFGLGWHGSSQPTLRQHFDPVWLCYYVNHWEEQGIGAGIRAGFYFLVVVAKGFPEGLLCPSPKLAFQGEGNLLPSAPKPVHLGRDLDGQGSQPVALGLHHLIAAAAAAAVLYEVLYPGPDTFLFSSSQRPYECLL